jgi:hypothetical protein
LAFLFNACSNSSKIIIPLPSPITNPSLPLSNGLDDFDGSSLYFVDKACDLQNPFLFQMIPLIIEGCNPPSTPPVIIILASPYLIILYASPIE